MLVGLIRHGLTDWNKIGRIQGQSDIPLNEEGRGQAKKLAERLLADQKYKWDFVITSGLSRAQETGEIIAKTLNIPLYDPDSRLVEKAFGQVEGLTAEERETLWGVDWKQRDLGQESDEAIQERALSFLKEIGEKYSDNNVLVVSHGGLLAQLFTVLYQNKCTERIGNLSLTILEKNDHNWDMRLYNCTRHLEDK
ncbi:MULTISPECIES: histidine phosphatase family protein [unclassified Paenibacillus]|uniref:histidine phosphatase family protein n=1 Tax=unclassified Paenibacillus TaxID=185978 RepID=UPI0008384EF6|nr:MULTISPECIES: histidine phosphatase family protein [unclassified Paenibacillus]NWL87289.1 histidine phosphatase family protein [Paenibacillus sp. 79R4]